MRANTFQVGFSNIAQYLESFANQRQEGKSGVIELKAIEADSGDPQDACDDPEIVKLMVGYFYHLDYLHDDKADADQVVVQDRVVVQYGDGPPPQKRARTSAPPRNTRASISSPSHAALPFVPKVHLIEHAKVFAMAVKYHVGALQNLAAQKFDAEVDEHWDHEDLARAIHIIYTSTANEVTQLRKIAVDVLDAYRDQLLGKPEIVALLRKNTGLACDLLMYDPPSSTRDHSPNNTPVQIDPFCYNEDLHSTNNEVWEETCNYCDESFQLCSWCNGDPTYTRVVWGCPYCGGMN